MKVFFITDYFWPSIGGLENSTAYLAEHLHRSIPVEVFTMTENPGKEMKAGFKIKRFGSYGNRAYEEMAKHVEEKAGPFALAVMGFSERWTRELLEFMQDLKRRFNCKILFKIPSVDSFSNFIPDEERLKKFMCVDHIICLNARIKRDLLQRGIPNEKLVSRANGVPTRHFVPAGRESKMAIRQRLGIDGKPTFIFTGRFSFVKRVDLLVKAFSQIESANLILAGDFDSRFAKGYSFTIPGNNDRIRVFKTTNNILPFLQAADVYVSASRSEGMSNSLLEAMSCGLPALASDIEGHRQPIIPGENGRLFQSENLEDLIEGIRWFIQSEHKFSMLSENARNTILSDYSIGRVAEVYINLTDNEKVLSPL